MKIHGFILLTLTTVNFASAFATPSPTGQKQAGLVFLERNLTRDRYIPVALPSLRLEGMLGERVAMNRTGHLDQMDVPHLLSGFKNRPGDKWIGEHAGKILDASALTLACQGDPILQEKVARLVRGLGEAQDTDGYLGTYLPARRWADWDVWVHKYDLIGLLSYYEVSGDDAALATAKRIGGLITKIFGDQPGKRDIIAAGEHLGMAATSILEPMVRLYRHTGDPAIIDFCRYVVRAYDRPNGPKIIQTLVKTGDVQQTADAKAYEMISNLIGLVELYRVTGDRALLVPVFRAWDDIVANRLYITGSASSGEDFQEAGELPADAEAKPGEGCVTVSWVQLNWHLLRLTGESRFGDELEQTVYNHLLAAQDPRRGAVCSYPPLIGEKAYFGGTHYCCTSSIARGLALIPWLVAGTTDDGGLSINLYTAGTFEAAIKQDGPDVNVKVACATTYPEEGAIIYRFRADRAAKYSVYFRVPGWAETFQVKAGGEIYSGKPGTLLKVERTWGADEEVMVDVPLPLRVFDGGKSYPDCVALQRGPQVLALERALNPEMNYLNTVAVTARAPGDLVATRSQAASGWLEKQTYEAPARFLRRDWTASKTILGDGKATLVPFADLRDGRVWLTKADRLAPGEVAATAYGVESASRTGSLSGAICDGLTDTYRNTVNSDPELDATVMDWFAVKLEQPQQIRRIVYVHGKVDRKRGGWFETARGKPQIQIQAPGSERWETVATLDAYPTINPGQVPTLKDFQAFEVALPRVVTAAAIRIYGRPGKGTRSDKGRAASCAELMGFTD